MPLLDLWENNPEAFTQFSIEQIVAMAGDGQLRDESACSEELRKYLSSVSTEKLAEHATRCLNSSFTKSGQALQDIVNEFGRRLDYEVENGLYQGRPNAVGFDGLWRAPDGHSLIVEVKTTDAYRINLDTIAGYRERLIQEGKISSSSSILIVVGRKDTGDLEAQIRGSRHAWDIRIISTDALSNLVILKEATDEDETLKKVRSLLIPFEYTRLDNIIDVVFAAARDVESAAESDTHNVDAEASERADGEPGRYEFTPQEIIRNLRFKIIDVLGRKVGDKLITHKRALYWSPDKAIRAACTISKRYERGSAYWYAYHPSWDEFLRDGKQSFFVLGCVDKKEAFALPFDFIHSRLDGFHQTVRGDGKAYWHIHLDDGDDGEVLLHLPKRETKVDLREFALSL